MALSSAHLLVDQLPGPAAVLLQILPGLLLPTGWSSLAVPAGVASLAGTFVVPPTSACTLAGSLSPALVGLTPHTSPSCSTSCSNLLPSSPAVFVGPPDSRSVPDERVLVAAGAARVPLVAAGHYPALPLPALQEVNLLLVDEHLEDTAWTEDSAR